MAFNSSITIGVDIRCTPRSSSKDGLIAPAGGSAVSRESSAVVSSFGDCPLQTTASPKPTSSVRWPTSNG